MSDGKKKTRALLVLALVLASVGVTAAAVYLSGAGRGESLPSGCQKPAGGFLIIASSRGFNDSIDHGVPSTLWPVISVKNGTLVTIVFCNTDSQSHSLQVGHYYDSELNAVAPGHVDTISFVANEKGVFQIYCQIFCTIHWAMQSGVLTVT